MKTKPKQEFKVKLTKQEKQLLIKYGHKDAADCDGCIVPKKTYLLINDLIKSVNRKEYGIGHTA